MKERKDQNHKQSRKHSRKWLSTPYSFLENLSWIKNNIFGPSKKYKELTSFVPQDVRLNAIEPKIKLGFIGDILPMGEKKLAFDSNLNGFLQDTDFLIGNFEGTISEADKVFMSQAHSERILADLEELFPPERIVLSLANNHSGDFGWNEFSRSSQILKNHGFLTIGESDKSSIMLEKTVNLSTATRWSNRPCSYISDLNDVEKSFNPEAKFNILYPHWGYELQLYPNPGQIRLGRKLLEEWDMIIGHHSHCPQPVTNESKKLLAYSLGDFSIGKNLRKYLYGMVIKTEIGPNNQGEWRAGEVEWRFIRIQHLGKFKTEIRLTRKCIFFS
ncbi:MAG: CapA family protein [Candidatus Hodarchaeota archaeon]